MYRCLMISTDTYHTSLGDFMVDVVENAVTYEAYLYHSAYGVKTLMFDLNKADVTKEKFLAIVNANLASYVDLYTQEYCD